MKTSGRRKPFRKTGRRAILRKSPKRLADTSKYRGITRLSFPGKILNRIILERLSAALETVTSSKSDRGPSSLNK